MKLPTQIDKIFTKYCLRNCLSTDYQCIPFEIKTEKLFVSFAKQKVSLGKQKVSHRKQNQKTFCTTFPDSKKVEF